MFHQLAISDTGQSCLTSPSADQVRRHLWISIPLILTFAFLIAIVVVILATIGVVVSPMLFSKAFTFLQHPLTALSNIANRS
jgi:hypothetical protein